MKTSSSGILIFVATSAAWAQGTSPPAKDVCDRVPQTALRLRPAAAPIPALKYQLIPRLLDQEPGNAAPLYRTAVELYHQEPKPDPNEDIDGWLKLPLKDLPRDKAREAVSRYPSAMRYLTMASRREYCRWDYPFRTEVYNTLLPELGPLRGLCKLLALQIRLEITEGRLDDAIEHLQAGFATARFIAQDAPLINALVGVYIAELMADQTQELLQAQGAPSLYWAVAAIPRPFIHIDQAMEYERSSVYMATPDVTRALRARAELDPQEWQRRLTDLIRLAGAGTPPDRAPAAASWDDRLSATALAVRLYPIGKQYLTSRGLSPDDVRKMPVAKVVVLYMFQDYAESADDVFKWFVLPFWQGHAGLVAAEAKVASEQEAGHQNPMLALLPKLSRASLLTANVDRRLDALQCVEAIRTYASGHAGTLPDSLDQLPLPVRADPMTGKPFEYRREQEKAYLLACPPDTETRFGIRYEITITR